MRIQLLFISLIIPFLLTAQEKEPIKIGVIGLTHTHVHWILGREKTPDLEIVGIVETNKDLAQRYTKQHGYSMDIVYDSIEDLIEATSPDAVTAFGTIYEHLEVVEKCAPLGIHVMVEKPLAVSLKHAKKMRSLAKKHNIHLLTNYETSWYASNHKAHEYIQEGKIGDLRKMVIHDGHQGPVEIGVNEEFLEWLLDPDQNGGGAITDFGCYGANLATWITNGKRPLSVMAVTQQIKPNLYPKVDDEATIILEYPKMQAIIQASWNWPFNRKDMEVYGNKGYIISDNGSDLRIRLLGENIENKEKTNNLQSPYNDPFSYFAGVINEEIIMSNSDVSSLANNMIVMEILNAAIKSAKKGKRIFLK